MNSVERVNAWRLNQSQHVLTELRKFERKRARKLSNSNSSFSSSANKVIDSLANLENIELARFKKAFHLRTWPRSTLPLLLHIQN